MRTLATAFSHAPAWRVEFFDAEGYLLETRMIDEIERARLIRSGDMIVEGGAAARSMRIVDLNENLEEEP
jgi:hypothetical protein